MRRQWSSEDDSVLRSLYGDVAASDIASRLGRSIRAVHGRADQLGITSNRAPLWSPSEDERLRQLFGSSHLEVIARETGRTLAATRERARVLGLFDGRPHPMVISQWEASEDAYLRRMYGQCHARQIAEHLGRGYGATRQRAVDLGITARQRNSSPGQGPASAPSLISSPYAAPACRPGDWLDDEINGRTEVGGWTDARIPWPRRKKTGRPSLILTAELARAVRTESVEAICHWWGVGPTKVWQWRQVLGVDTTPGSRRIARRGVPAEAAAKGRARAAEADVRARMAEAKRGRPAHPQTRAALLRAAQSPKPDGWGQRANRWMQDAKRNRDDD